MAKEKISMKEEMRIVALNRIHKLFEQAEKNFTQRPDRSKRYVELARKIAMRHNIKFDVKLKKKFCKKCGAYLVIGKNAKIRVSGRLLKITCCECNFTRKIGLKEKKSTKDVGKNIRNNDPK
ncbi:MAG: ribonuclease P [Candidatus Diapherotrites archaeon]